MRTALVRGAALLAAGAGLASLVVGGGVAVAGQLAPAVRGWSAAAGETLFTALIFAPLLLAAIIAARAGGQRAARPGPDGWRQAGLGAAIGLAGLAAAIVDVRLAGTLERTAVPAAGIGLLLWGAALVLFQAGSEELFFRGWLQPALAARWGRLPAILGASAAFALAHLAGGERAPLSLVNLLLGGVLFGLLAARAGGLAAAIGAHFAWNGGEQLIFGLDPNPGVGGFGALADHDLVGPALWGGSAEGLNGSIVMTAVLLAMVVPLALVRGPGAPALSLPRAPAPGLSGRAL